MRVKGKTVTVAGQKVTLPPGVELCPRCKAKKRFCWACQHRGYIVIDEFLPKTYRMMRAA